MENTLALYPISRYYKLREYHYSILFMFTLHDRIALN